MLRKTAGQTFEETVTGTGAASNRMNFKLNGGKRILVVEDDPDHAGLLQEGLERAGYHVAWARSGVEALELVDSWRPNLALMDFYLPDRTGTQLLNELRTLDDMVKLPVIMMSADDSETNTIAALGGGAFDFIRKPLRMADLRLKIEHALELQFYKNTLEETNQKLEAEKRRLLRYFPDNVVSRILTDEISSAPGGVLQNATILFLDLRNSTGMAEEIGASAFAGMLNMLFTDFMDFVFGYGGSVNKLLGDGILATFGCPEESPDDARNCVRCARDIRHAVHTINDLEPDFLPGPIKIGMGVASGKVFAGNVGSIRRMEYTVLGDAVNVAARLQYATKKLDTDLLIDDETVTRLAGDDEFEFQRAGVARLRGKTQRQAVCLLGDKAPVRPGLKAPALT